MRRATRARRGQAVLCTRALRTHVQIRSSKFPSYDTDEDGGECNPGIWGKRLAVYLREQLHMRGVKAGEPFAEDWGFVIPIEHESFELWLGCANDPELDEGYLVFVQPSTPTVRRLFKPIDTTADVGRVVSALDEVFAADPDIRDVKWWTADELGASR